MIMKEKRYTVSLTEGQVLLINKLVCEESYKISNRILDLNEGKEKDDLRKERDILMEMGDVFTDSILDIMAEYGIE